MRSPSPRRCHQTKKSHERPKSEELRLATSGDHNVAVKPSLRSTTPTGSCDPTSTSSGPLLPCTMRTSTPAPFHMHRPSLPPQSSRSPSPRCLSVTQHWTSGDPSRVRVAGADHIIESTSDDQLGSAFIEGVCSRAAAAPRGSPIARLATQRPTRRKPGLEEDPFRGGAG